MAWFDQFTPGNWGGPQAYGTKPNVPSPTGSAAQALSGNIGNLGQIYGLGAGLNQFQAQQAASQIAQNLPGYQNLIAQSSGNIGQMLAGQVPSDVVNQITQGAAERGIITGQGGGQNTNAALLKALGLTSIGLQQTGEQELTAAIGRTPTGGLFQPSSMLVSPEQQQQAMMAQELYRAAPDPTAAAMASLANAQRGLAAGGATGGGGVSPFKGYGTKDPFAMNEPFGASSGGGIPTGGGMGTGTDLSNYNFSQAFGLGNTGAYTGGVMGTLQGLPGWGQAPGGYGGLPNYGAGAPTLQNAAALGGSNLLDMPQLSSIWGGENVPTTPGLPQDAPFAPMITGWQGSPGLGAMSPVSSGATSYGPMTEEELPDWW